MEAFYMLSNNSDYAVNKTDPEAIVCRSVTSENVRLTREHFDSDEEFQKCKAWSDEDYRNSALRERALNDRRYSFELDHLLDRHEYSDWLSAELKGSEKLKKGEIISIIRSIIRSILTDTQFRRLWQRFACEYELAEIASSEGVSVTAVVDSIRYAMKRLESIKFSTHLKTYDAARNKANNKCQSKSNAHNRDGSQQQNCELSVSNFILHKIP
jgi:predicted DNA-binding protein YlxM (UPF0122 family)